MNELEKGLNAIREIASKPVPLDEIRIMLALELTSTSTFIDSLIHLCLDFNLLYRTEEGLYKYVI